MEIDRALENAARAQAAANAFITLRAQDDLLAEASPPGPLSGKLLSITDDLFTAGLRTTGGSQAFAQFVPQKDAPAVARLREAGATVLGKTNLSEFAMSLEEGSPLAGPCRHPEMPDRWAGASSGGAAAAAFFEAGDAAVATDSGGSARAPAALCGVACYNATPDPGLRGGSFGANNSLLAIGVLSRSIRTAGSVGQALLAARITPPEAAPPPASRFLWCDLSVGMDGHDTRVSALVRALVDRILSSMDMREVAADTTGLRTADTFAVISDYERLGEMIRAGTLDMARPELLGPATRDRLERARNRTEADYRRCLLQQDQAKARIEGLFELADVVLTPTVSFLAPQLSAGGPLVDPGLYGANLTWVNLAELPAVSIPVGRVDGLPVGLQIVARRHDDLRLLRLAEAIEARLGGR